MRVIAKRTLREFWESDSRYVAAKGQLEAWHKTASKAIWQNSSDIKMQFRHASILKNHRVVFNIAGNKYRLVTVVDYTRQTIFIRFVGTHEQYDKIDAETI